MPTSASIRTALVNTIKTIQIANGYLQDIPVANVFEKATPYQHMQQVDPAVAYPRVFVFSEGADYADLPARRILKKEMFSVVALFAKPDSTKDVAPTVQTMVENYISDFEVMIDRHKQFGGCDVVELHSVADDLGASATEAAVIFELHVTFKRSFN